MKNLNKLFYEELHAHVGKLLFVLGLMMATAGLEALSPWPFKFLIDNVLGNEPIDKTGIVGFLFGNITNQELLGYVVVFTFFLISLLLSITQYYRAIEVKKVIRDIIFKFSQKAFRNLELLDMGFFRQQEVGDYIYRLSYDVSAIGELIEEGILPIITSGLYLLFTTIFLFYISVRLTFIALSVLPFLILCLYFFNKRIVRVSKRSEYWNSTLFSFIEQALNQLKIIQAFSQEKNEAKHFDKKIYTQQETDLRLYKVNFLLSLLVGIIIALSYSLIIALGIRYYYAGELTTGLLVVFIFYLDNLTNPILDIIFATSEYKEARVKINRMKDFFDKKTHTENVGKLTAITHPSIQFRHVYLEGEDGTNILDDISFTIEAGTLTVLVGVSGSGKTSLISLIPKLISSPSKGDILIGGKNINDYALETLRSSISIVPQENVLFNQTIAEIIAYGKSGASMAEIQKAAILANADKFIHKHQGGYNFLVGEGGNYLSGGQRQRLSLARAFLKDAQILIFDEPLSALDIQTRAIVWGNINAFSKGKTTIIVTNILDVINKADQVLVMSNGKLVKAGKHTEVLKDSHLLQFIARTD